MAVIETRTFNPKLPRREDLDPTKLVISYDEASDTLMAYLYGRSQPAFSLDVGDDLYLRVDVETDEVVGFQIEHFLVSVVKEQPGFLEIAELAGVPAKDIAEIRRSTPRETRQRAALDAVFHHLAALSYPAEDQEGVNWQPPVLSIPTP